MRRATGRRDLVLPLLLVLGGCGLLPEPFKGYEGTERPDAELVVIDQRDLWRPADILRITDKQGNVIYAASDDTPPANVVRLLPGEYGIKYEKCLEGVTFIRPERCVSRFSSVLFKAGHVYAVQGEFLESVWIEDQTTAEIVAGSEP